MSGNFWTDADAEKQELARTFYEGIEYDHPKHLSGRSPREYGWCGCSWCATAIKYPTYKGPSL